MPITFDRQQLHVEITNKECDIPEDQRTRMVETLRPLEFATADFPRADLRLNIIYHPNSKVYHAEAKLKLPGRTIFSGDHDTYLDTAFQRCLRRVLDRLDEYKQNPNNGAIHQAEQRQARDTNIMMPEDADTGPIANAVKRGDYREFRTRMAGYEDWLRRRVGRWIQRFPEAESRVNDGPFIGDLVELVYLNAFEQFTDRNTTLRMSEWLDSLIDPSLRESLRHPDEVHQEASLARTIRAMDMK